MPYCLGRLPNDPSKPRVRLGAHLYSGTVPPAAVNWHSAAIAWGELGNNEWGDCVLAGNGHLAELATFYGQNTEAVITTDEVLAEYSRVTGFDPAAGPSGDNPTDQGATIQDGLSDLRRNGLAGVTIAAFAEISVTNVTGIQTACADLGGLSIGVNLPQSAVDQFHAGQPWDITASDGGNLGGHCVVLAGYDTSYLYVITWGQVQKVTFPWFGTYAEEAWAVVSKEWVAASGKDPEGVDLVSLGAEFASITGEPSPFPAQPPAPVPIPPAPKPAPVPVPVTPPAPAPVPVPDPHALLAELAALIKTAEVNAERDLAVVADWIRAHGL